jgi:hypothetical protein
MNKKKYQARFPMVIPQSPSANFCLCLQARIKKIMQKDEEVGKIAQMTPVVMSKAVELFMAALVEAASSQAKFSASKRILPQHLKVAIQNVESFDFLKDLVVNVPILPEQKDNNSNATPSNGTAKKKKL